MAKNKSCYFVYSYITLNFICFSRFFFRLWRRTAEVIANCRINVTNAYRGMSSPKVPEFVYANNGAKYHPCLYCCRAFAHKRYLSLHMKACVRTHLHEDDHKPSVSVFPSTLMKEEEEETGSTTSQPTIDIHLPHEISIETRPRRLRSRVEGLDSQDEIKDDPPEKKFRLNESPSDENANMHQENPTSTAGKNDARKFSMENACKLCDEIFYSLDELIMHAKIEHNQRSKDNKKFSPEDIEYFLKVFTKMNKSHCPICRKAILNTLNWRGHLYTHCTERKFVCKICGKWFTRGNHCKQHELRHKHGSQTGDSPDEEVEWNVRFIWVSDYECIYKCYGFNET